MRSAVFAALRKEDVYQGPQSDVVKAARAFRADLIKGNDEAIRELTRQYERSWRILRTNLKSVTAKVKEARKLGVDADPAWLYQQTRYRDLMVQIEGEMRRYSTIAADTVTPQQRRAAALGLAHSEELVMRQLPAELGFAWNTVHHAAVQSMVGFLGDGAPLSYKFAELEPEVAQGIKDVLGAGVTQGWNPYKTVSVVKQIYGQVLSNAVVTARTETMRAYRTAAQEGYRANSDVVMGWIWLSAKSGTTCEACWALDGTFHKLEEQFSDHICGLCVALPCTRPIQELFPGTSAKDTSAKPWSSDEEFAKLDESKQLKVLGPGRFALYQDGKFKISDGAVLQKSEVWGDHYRPKTLGEIKKEIGNAT